jgi:hypothetical protein
MTMSDRDFGGRAMRHPVVASRDHDVHKGAIEEGRPNDTTNAPGLDNDGLPNDATLIAADALGARQDGTQG